MLKTLNGRFHLPISILYCKVKIPLKVNTDKFKKEVPKYYTQVYVIKNDIWNQWVKMDYQASGSGNHKKTEPCFT